MSHVYFDSSALVKRYVAEVGTSWIMGLCAPDTGNALYTVRISAAEIVAALFRRDGFPDSVGRTDSSRSIQG